MSSPARTAAFIVPRPEAPSGGHAYNDAVLRHWPGDAPVRIEIPGPWPYGDEASLRTLREELASAETVLLDGLVGAAHPDLIVAASESGHQVVLLIHLPLADEFGLDEEQRADLAEREHQSIEAAWRVVTTSRHAAIEVGRTHHRADVVAVPPGTDEAALAERHDPPRLLQVGSIGPRKNQLGTLAALARCDDLDWSMTFVGPVADPDYAEELTASLSDRATWAGALVGDALEDAYGAADLLVHPARAETWGMVVTEALARGIPVVVGAGTGAVEALTSGSGTDGAVPGAAVLSGHEGELAIVLRRWLTDRELRDEWRARAEAARPRLRRWPDAADELARVLEDR
ncbi:MAG TPA: glycosyltransferase family 4 protein [Propionibacteriaceae bacterium]|nr:glycosyltransferase family 4 protein [Propionibacteriaceae bacterium]HPZ49292.1 glycosyltransferase family 4 protein [Propionibacteriaceae bacterium]HQE32496.1 glycosyltransferase family 4 protein [Propionibacteriaceae bacterium]